MIRVWTIILGILFGYLIKGPAGAIFGILLGHFFANSYIRLVNYQKRIQILYFKALFLVAGRMCKADGVVTDAEIQVIQQLFAEMEVTEDGRKQAIEYFKQGLRNDFNMRDTLEQLHKSCKEQQGLLRLFIQTVFTVAQVDGLNATKRQLLDEICSILGFDPKYYYEQSDHSTSNNQNYSQNKRHSYQPPPQQTVNNDYALLEVPHDVSARDLKKAYRRLMSQHHPDKLIAQGLPESMIKMATHKTQEIQAAYERIKKAKGY